MSADRLSVLRRRLVQATVVTPVLAAWAPVLAQGAQPEKGKYRVVDPIQATENAARIEVVDFFWYGCPHCFSFMPALSQWKETLPKDVHYRYLPVAFDPRNEPHTRLFYTLDVLGQAEALHAKVFDAIHKQKRALRATDDIADFAQENGIDRKQWLDTFNSFSVQTRAKRARQVWMGYKIEGTPTLGIDGRYITSPTMAGSYAATFAVAEYWIEQLRRDKAGNR